jgi:radical SAM domain protein
MERERLRRGVLIRHLILPGQVENSLRVLDWIGETFPKGTVLVSLMRQYTPMPRVAGLPPLDRQVTQEEYEAVLSWMYLNELDGFVQEEAAASEKFIPNFKKE